MTAQIILFPISRMSRSSQLPPPIDVALDHVLWLRLAYPSLGAHEAGMTYGLYVYSWAELIRGLAEIWDELPEDIRREGC